MLQKHLLSLEDQLKKTAYLIHDHLKITDLAIFPMIRQMIKVNQELFQSWSLPYLFAWYHQISSSGLFDKTMEKYTPWVPGQDQVLVNVL